MVLTIIEEIKKVANHVEDFISDNAMNPLMWITIFLVGLIIFFWTYNKLNK